MTQFVKVMTCQHLILGAQTWRKLTNQDLMLKSDEVYNVTVVSSWPAQMWSAASWKFLAMLLCSVVLAKADRGKWLCDLVDKMADKHPGYNVLGFKGGYLNANDLVEEVDVTYPPGCNQKAWLALHAIGKVSVPAAGKQHFLCNLPIPQKELCCLFQSQYLLWVHKTDVLVNLSLQPAASGQL